MDAYAYWHWADSLLRSGPLGHNPFFLGPLYPYLLAGLRTLFGDSVHAVLIVQATWGALAALLLADAARRLTRPAVGFAVGLVAAFYEMSVFFDGLVLMESLLFVLEAFLLWWIVRRHADESWVTPATAGLVVGLLAQGRATSALLLLPAALAVLPPMRAGLGRILARTGVLLGVFALVCLPAAARNYVVAHEWIPFTYNLGCNLYIGNGPGATGGFWHATGGEGGLDMGAEGGIGGDGRDYLRAAKGLTLSPAQSSRWWAQAAMRFAAEHPGRTAALWLRKLGMMWSRHEYAQIEHVEEYRSMAGPLGIPGLGQFAIIGALGIAGMFFARQKGRPGVFLLGYAAVMTLAIAPFFVTDRYRHHLVPGVLLLSGIALERAWQVARRRRLRELLTLAVAVLAGVVVVSLPMPTLSRPRYAWGLASDLGSRWLEHGRPDLAAREFERAIGMESSGALGRAVGGEAFRIGRAELHQDYAKALRQLGRHEEALRWHEQAVTSAPTSAAAVDALIAAYERAGRTTEAQALIERLDSLAGGHGRALMRRGWQAARAGQLAVAESLFTAAVANEPRLTEAWVELVKSELADGRVEDARASLARARNEGLSGPLRHACEAMIAAQAGDAAGARRALGAIQQEAIARDPYLAGLVGIVERLLQ
ncbi:MAG: glycosyltransferase family 39 protein [Candidatus Eisenbacteria bacterium]|nr:glycosyltransferase family 39 protein [Candidatus Eisenbacteria bacterium]